MPTAQDLIERARMFEERAERACDPISPTALQRVGRSLSIAVGRASGNKAGTRIGALRETALENARLAAHIT